VRDDERQLIRDVVGSEAEVRFDEPMARHTTLRIGGPVDAWIAPTNQRVIAPLRKRCHELGIATHAFGAGSNLLVRDGGVRGVALSLRHLNNVSWNGVDENVVFVEAGASTGKLLAYATKKGLGGLEFLGGVPGTVGGGLIMNAGTYLGEFKDVTAEVLSVTADGTFVTRNNAECGFAYRKSLLPPSEIVTYAKLELRPRPTEEIVAVVRELRDRRKAREPHGVPNAGSIFKNPPNDFAGRLIEACGLKGRRVGGAEVSPAHANWLVNAESATAKDMLALIEIVRAEVAAKFGITLELEVKVVGEA
jgi:UDP-N-acetylmuramate dehydrogenase